MRIEFDNVEQDVKELEGIHIAYAGKNPVTANDLHDDEFNFISGMNYVASLITENFKADIKYNTGLEVLDAILKQRDRQLIDEFAQYVFTETEALITGFIDGYKEVES